MKKSPVIPEKTAGFNLRYPMGITTLGDLAEYHEKNSTLSA